MKNVLIVSYHFPPENMLASKRYGTMCKYMEKYGWKPYIVTQYEYGDLKVPIDERYIIRIGNKNRRKFHNLSALQNTLIMICDYFKIGFRSFGKTDFSWFNEVKSGIQKINEVCPNPDIIIGTFPPVSNIFIARYLSKYYKVPWVAEIRDLISLYREDFPEGYRQLVLLDYLYERVLLSSARGIVAVTKGFKRQLNKYYSKRIAVIYNGFDRWKSEEILTKEGLPDKYLYYAGTLYEHRMESLYLLLSALKAVPHENDIKLVIRIAHPENFGTRLFEYIRKNRLEGRVILKNECDENTVRNESASALANVVISDLSNQKEYLLSTIPGKFMELLGERPPILVIAAPEAEMASVLKLCNKGIATNSKKEIIDFILESHDKYVGKSEEIKKYSREYQTRRLCSFLDSLTGKNE